VSKIVKLFISLVLSIAGLYYAFRKMDLDELWLQLTQVHISYILFSTVLMIYSVVIRARRWKLILEPIEEIPVRVLFGATMIGYFGNSVLPLRMGEVLRGYSIGKQFKVGTSSALGTIILERVLDMLGLIFLIIIFLILSPINEWLGEILYGVIFVTLIAFIFVFWLGRTKVEWQPFLLRFRLLDNRLGRRLINIIQNLISGITALKNTSHALKITFYTLYIWFIYYVYMLGVVTAIGVNLDWIGIGIILITTSLSISIPAAPGYIGTYHAVAVYVLTNIFNVGLTEAQAFAIIVHAVGYVPFVILGSYYFLRSSIHLSDVKSEALL